MSSSRLAIGQGLVALLQGIQNPNTSTALYSYVKLGAIFDPTPYTLWCEVVPIKAKSGPVGSGGNLVGWRIESEIIFEITSGYDYEQDSTAATTNILTTMDIVAPTLHSHYQIPNASNPSVAIASVFSLLEDQQERIMPVRFPNGRVYLLWKTYALVKEQYGVIISQP